MARLVGSSYGLAYEEGRHRNRRGPERRMTHVLLLSNESDYSLDRVVHWLAENEPAVSVQRVNREDLTPLGRLTAVLGPHGWRVDERPLVVWLRQLLPERDPYGPSPEPGEIDDILVSRRQWLAWMNLIDRLGGRWLNDPVRVRAAESKIDQLAVASRIGFNVPRTLLTSDRRKAEAFVADLGLCIVKSLTAAFWEFSDQSFVFTTDAREALEADELAWTSQPVLVQELITGSADARLLLIDGVTLGACRQRDTLDWRTRASGTWLPWIPDPATVANAQAYAREFGLEYAAFDFIIGSDAHVNPVFLECNPAGEFGFLDDALRGEPTRQIGRLLARLAIEEC